MAAWVNDFFKSLQTSLSPTLSRIVDIPKQYLSKDHSVLFFALAVAGLPIGAYVYQRKHPVTTSENEKSDEREHKHRRHKHRSHNGEEQSSEHKRHRHHHHHHRHHKDDKEDESREHKHRRHHHRHHHNDKESTSVANQN